MLMAKGADLYTTYERMNICVYSVSYTHLTLPTTSRV